VHRYVVEVRSILLGLQSSVLRNKYDLKKRGKLCDLTRERQVKFFILKA
jgi:hypothetical protein